MPAEVTARWLKWSKTKKQIYICFPLGPTYGQLCVAIECHRADASLNWLVFAYNHYHITLRWPVAIHRFWSAIIGPDIPYCIQTMAFSISNAGTNHTNRVTCAQFHSYVNLINGRTPIWTSVCAYFFLFRIEWIHRALSLHRSHLNGWCASSICRWNDLY